MRIFGAKTVAEFKQMRKEKVQHWIDYHFVSGSVDWCFETNLNIRITDKTGDYMIISLDDMDDLC